MSEQAQNANLENVLVLKAGDYTEDAISFLLEDLDDKIVDQIEVKREYRRRDDLASEPITVSVALTLGTAAVIQIGRLIERWLETHRQIKNLELVLEAHKLSQEAGESLKELANSHSNVALKYELPEPSGTATSG